MNDYTQALSELVYQAWRDAEPGFREFKCSRAQVDYLRKMGFDVTENIAIPRPVTWRPGQRQAGHSAAGRI